MSNVVKGNDPDKIVFAFQPKPFQAFASTTRAFYGPERRRERLVKKSCN